MVKNAHLCATIGLYNPQTRDGLCNCLNRGLCRGPSFWPADGQVTMIHMQIQNSTFKKSVYLWESYVRWTDNESKAVLNSLSSHCACRYLCPVVFDGRWVRLVVT